MENVILSILTSVIGLGVGAASVVVYNNRKSNSASNKAESIIEKAKKPILKMEVQL